MDHWKKVYELGGRLGFVRGLFEFTANHVHYLDLPSLTLCMRRSRNILSFSSRRWDSGIMPTRCSLASLTESTLSFFFFDFVIHESSFGWATVMSFYPRSFNALDTVYADPDASNAILVSTGIFFLNSVYPSYSWET